MGETVVSETVGDIIVGIKSRRKRCNKQHPRERVEVVHEPQGGCKWSSVKLGLAAFGSRCRLVQCHPQPPAIKMTQSFILVAMYCYVDGPNCHSKSHSFCHLV